MTKRKKIIFISAAAAVVIIAACVIVAVMLNRQNTPLPIDTTKAQSSSATDSSSASSDFKVEVIPPLPSSKPASSEAASESSDKAVSSAAPSSKAPDKSTSSKSNEIKVTGNTSSKPVSSKPTTSSTPPPVSSQTPVEPLPPPTSEPTNPPFNPDGPQHGDTMEFDGETQYFHVGMKTSKGNGAYIPEDFWDTTGNFPDFSGNSWKPSEYTESFGEGKSQITLITKRRLYWCKCGINPRHNNCWKSEEIYLREHPNTTK